MCEKERPGSSPFPSAIFLEVPCPPLGTWHSWLIRVFNLERTNTRLSTLIPGKTTVNHLSVSIFRTHASYRSSAPHIRSILAENLQEPRRLAPPSSLTGRKPSPTRQRTRRPPNPALSRCSRLPTKSDVGKQTSLRRGPVKATKRKAAWPD